MRKSLVRTVVLAFVVFAALFTLEFVLEWRRLGFPGMKEISWAGVNNTKLVDVMSPMARAYNNILAMLLATIGLAIPLTANMHTPKLIDIFLRDRLNQFMLLFMALGAANAIYVAYLVGPEFAPMWALRISVYVVLAGWAFLIPYFFYVMRFLDPSNIIERLRNQTTDTFDQVAAGKLDPEEGQDRAIARIEQIGTIVLKSLDRADRAVALEGVWAFKRILDHYGPIKSSMPEGWFKVERSDFVGLSHEALEMLTRSRTWAERKTLSQMFLGYEHALSKASDTVSSMSDANRVIATTAAERGDREMLTLSIHFFNSFLRAAIKKKDPRAIFDIFYQYRLLARDLGGQPEFADTLRRIGRAFRFYAETAGFVGMTYAHQLAAFDLAYVVRRAYEAGSPAAADLLDEILRFDHGQGDRTRALIVKAKLILGGFFLQQGRSAEAEKVAADLKGVDRKVVTDAERDLLAAEEAFFEVTDRQINMEYLPPERRDPMRQFVASLA